MFESMSESQGWSPGGGRGYDGYLFSWRNIYSGVGTFTQGGSKLDILEAYFIFVTDCARGKKIYLRNYRLDIFIGKVPFR